MFKDKFVESHFKKEKEKKEKEERKKKLVRKKTPVATPMFYVFRPRCYAPGVFPSKHLIPFRGP